MDVRTGFSPTPGEPLVIVNSCLTKLGVGTLESDDLTSFSGRNDNWAGRTSLGRSVFVKRLSGDPDDASRRFNRTVEFDQATQKAGIPTPQTLVDCPEHGLTVSELVSNVSTGAEVAARSEFTERVSEEAGRIIGRLHSCEASPNIDDSPAPLPNIAFLDSLPLEVYLGSTAAELIFWRLTQGDPALVESLRSLREWERLAPRTPTHCDFRLDQLLLNDDTVMLTDGEEFRSADPARDVGSYAGEWLFLAVTGIVDAKRHETLAEEPLTHEEVIRAGSRRIAERRPLISAFWRGYLTHREPDEDLRRRACAYAGWHLMDRALAIASRGARLSASVRAAMGIGRRALQEPERFIATLGLGEAR